MNLGDVFERTDLLPVLLLAPVVAALLAWLERRRDGRRRAALGPGAQRLVRADEHVARRVGRRLCVLGLGAASIALLRPVWGDDVRPVVRRGVDVVLCLDVSRSMLAEDVRPSRLQRAKDDIAALARHVRGDRIGLVAFAGDARWIVPLTDDMASLTALLDDVDPLAVSRGGTDLGAALDTAASALARSIGDDLAMVLLSDGEDLHGRGQQAAASLARRGVTVHTVAYGTEHGGKIVWSDGDDQQFLRDARGDEVVTSLDEAGLRAVAEATGGEFVDATRLPAPLVELHERRILPRAEEILARDGRRERSQRFQWPLLAAFVLWCAELARLGGRRGTARRDTRDARDTHDTHDTRDTRDTRDARDTRGARDARDARSASSFAGVALLAACCLGLPACGGADEAPLHYDQALAALVADDLRAAEDALSRAESARGAHSLLGHLAFLRGNMLFARAEQAAAQASGPEAEPFAWDVAVRRADDARQAWMAAASSRDDWPAARRNVERALLRLAEYRRARDEARGARSLPDEERRVLSVELPPDAADTDGPPELDDADAQAAPDELPADAVAALLETLRAKEREKRALRRASRAEAQLDVERDW